MVSKISEISKSLELLSIRIADINEKLAVLSGLVTDLDRDRLDQWKIIKDICDKINNDK